MKKLFVVCLCLMVCFSFTGCNSNSKIKNEEARAALEKVLNYEETFNLKNPDYDIITKENLEYFGSPQK